MRWVARAAVKTHDEWGETQESKEQGKEGQEGKAKKLQPALHRDGSLKQTGRNTNAIVARRCRAASRHSIRPSLHFGTFLLGAPDGRTDRPSLALIRDVDRSN